MNPWLWPDHVIGKRESGRLREEHNAAVNEAAELLAACKAAVERMESVAASIPVHNRHKGISQAKHVAHMAGHLEQHAKIARAALTKAKREY